LYDHTVHGKNLKNSRVTFLPGASGSATLSGLTSNMMQVACMVSLTP
jgi:hypothetical protein